MRTSPTNLLYIGGCGRSGSTLLERMLGQVPGFCSIGEVRHLWRRGVVEDQLCGCGERFHACSFWTDVGQRAFGGWGSVDAERVMRLDRSVDRHRYVPLLAAPRSRPAFARNLDAYIEILDPLYRAVRQTSAADVIIDSTADPSYALILGRVPSIDLRVAHLVRDARGVAYSWTKRVVRPEITGDTVYMPTYRPASSAAMWLTYNLLFEVFARSRLPRHLVRYEELVSNPSSQLTAVLRFAGHEPTPDDLAFMGTDGLQLRPTHTVAGNPMRFAPSIQLRMDEAWRSKMPSRQRAFVSGITWPLLLRYRYMPDRSGDRS